jgi:hypothetical protein
MDRQKKIVYTKKQLKSIVDLLFVRQNKSMGKEKGVWYRQE